MYSNPVLLNNSKLVDLSIKCKVFGPIITPASIKPMMPGMLNFLKISGEKRIMSNTSESTNTGLVNGI